MSRFMVWWLGGQQLVNEPAAAPAPARGVPQAILECEHQGVRQLLWHAGEAWEHDGRGNWTYRGNTEQGRRV